MTTQQRRDFEKTFDVIKVDSELGIVYGWGAIFTEDGEEYFDTQGDAIAADGAEAAALEFMQNSRVAGDLHETECGTVPFCMPITAEVAKALNIETTRTGLAIGMLPSEDVLEKFKTGEYTGFSIGGVRIEEEVVEKGGSGNEFVAEGTIAKKGDSDKKFRRGKRRRMTKWRLDEISAVDRPAQVEAKALLIKRKGDPDYDPDEKDPEKRGRMEDVLAKRAMLTSETRGHSHLLVLDHEFGDGARASGETMHAGNDYHSHPWVMNADGEVVIGAAAGHTHEPGTLGTTRDIANSSLIGKQEISMPLTNEEIAKQNERIEKIARLTDVRKQHFLTLEGDAADAFLNKSTDEQDAEIAAVAKSDADEDTVYTADDGTIYKRGDDPRLVKMAQDRDADRRKIAQLSSVNENASLEKRADELFPNLPGTSAERAALVKAVDGIEDKDLREQAIKSIQAGDKAIKSAFDRVGNTSAGTAESANAHEELEEIAKKLQAADPKMTYVDAYDAAAKNNPELAKRAVGSEGVDYGGE